MKTWMSLVVCLWSSTCFGAGLPTFTAIAKHPVGDGAFMLVVPGYQGLPIFVDAQDRVVQLPAQRIAAPTTWTRLSDGSLLYSPQPQLAPIFVNPQPAYVVYPTPLRTARSGPPILGP